MRTKPICYLCGPIHSSDGWKAMDRAANVLTAAGWVVLNPSLLPMGLAREQTASICKTMIECANVVITMEGYERSAAAGQDAFYAVSQGMDVMDIKEAMCLDVSRQNNVSIHAEIKRFRAEKGAD